MARARRRSRPTVSLFPFLSVLACVIGVLTLLIAANAIGQIATDAIDLELYEKLERQIESDRRELAALAALSNEVDVLGADIDAERQASEALEGLGADARELLARTAPLRRELEATQVRVGALTRELDPLATVLAARREAVEERERDRADAPILIQPSGSGFGLEPRFIETRPEGIVLYEGLERVPRPIPTHRIPTSAELRRFLRAARFAQNTTIIFLVRPGGVSAHELAKHQTAFHGVRNGEIPIPGEGKLDFSALERGG